MSRALFVRSFVASVLGGNRGESFFAMMAGVGIERDGAVRGAAGGAGSSFAEVSRIDTGIIAGALNLSAGVQLTIRKRTKCSSMEAARKRMYDMFTCATVV
jgi:hypothetical protein